MAVPQPGLYPWPWAGWTFPDVRARFAPGDFLWRLWNAFSPLLMAASLAAADPSAGAGAGVSAHALAVEDLNPLTRT
jgi:hypothetical protein